ncbi:MAG TPA: glycoside hydrolase domain-containing protein, partial [Gemmatimonadales bacterium]|nr:glycoside hydrolase domain-containing protein [Gemmatimonadales bacterium]
MKKLALVCLLVAPSLAAAQDVPYRIGRWDADSLGNHRAVLRVDSAAKAVRVTIPWRRRDQHPELTQIMVTNAAGRRVTNAVPIEITRERGTLAFEPSS